MRSVNSSVPPNNLKFLCVMCFREELSLQDCKAKIVEYWAFRCLFLALWKEGRNSQIRLDFLYILVQLLLPDALKEGTGNFIRGRCSDY